MIKVGLYGRSSLEKHGDYLHFICDVLKTNKIDYVLSSELAKIMHDASTSSFDSHESLMKQGIDILISLGGDGTMLDTVTYIKDSGIPILGINLGRLGFLASIAKEETEKAILSLAKGAYQIEKRMLLELQSNIPIFEGQHFALNEMTIQRSNSSSMIVVNSFVNGELLNQYFTDGLIVCTPTGSTGYNLSCGGPIMHPLSNNFIITPIAPHNLNVRPIVLADDITLTFQVSGRTDHFLCTLDSRHAEINSTFEIGVKKAHFSLHLVRLHDNSFLDALKAKLMWGLDNRA